MLVGAARGEKGSVEDQMRLLDVDTRRLSGLKYELICHFVLAADVRGMESGSL